MILMFVRNNPNDDKLCEVKSFNANFEVNIFLFILYIQFYFLYLYFILLFLFVLKSLFADESVQKVTLDKNLTKKVFYQKRQEGVYWLSEVDHSFDNAILQRRPFLSYFHTDTGSVSCRSPAGLNGIKICLILSFTKI